jgi:hypothetical protein
MGAVARPIPENGDMSQAEQAALILRTGDGVAVENEAEELKAEWGEPEDGVYAPNPEAREAFREGDDA